MSFWKKLFGVRPSQKGGKEVTDVLHNNVDLLKAAEEGDTALVQTLLTRPANVNAKDENGETALILAARKGHTTTAQSLLAGGSDVNAKNILDQTALMYAALGNHIDTVQVLLSQGANVNAKDIMGRSALMVASAYGNSLVVQTLLAASADVNAKSSDGATALMLAAQGGQTTIIQILLDEGADVNVSNNKGATPLLVAAVKGHAAVTETLLAHGAHVNAVNNEGATALMYAARLGHTAVVDVLLANGADVNAKDNFGQTALMDAEQEGHTRVAELIRRAAQNTNCLASLIRAAFDGDAASVQALLDMGINVNAKYQDGWTVLMAAAQEGHVNTVQVLLARGADVNANNYDGATPLMLAAKNGRSEIIRILLNRGANPNTGTHNNWTAIMWAAHEGHADAVQALVERGADPNVKTIDGWMALILAASRGHIEIVQALLSQGANANANAQSGSTALLVAAENGHIAIVHTLLDASADVNAKTLDGATALILAAQGGHTEIVQVLLSHGADINAKTREGGTALIAASHAGRIETVRVLLSGGANANARWLDGRTALMIAAKNGYAEIVELFKESGIEDKDADAALSSQRRSSLADESTSSTEYAQVVRMLEEMASEDIDLSDAGISDIGESLAITQRQERIVEAIGTSAVPGLCYVLTHAAPKVRKKGCWALLVLGLKAKLPEEAILAIANLIADVEEKVREQALHSLRVLTANNDLAVVIPYLVAALKSADPKTRKVAAEVLGKMGQDASPALGPLRALLNDSDIDAAEAAKAAVFNLGGEVDDFPAPGSLEEVERLARLTTSSDFYIPNKAWAALKELKDPETAIEPLMKAFRRHSGINGSTLCDFLGTVGSESCRKPLLEILDYASRSTDEWDKKFLLGSACANLLKLPGGVTALRGTGPSDLFCFIIARAMMRVDDEERSRIVELLTEDERQDTIIELITLFRSVEDKGEWVRDVSYALSPLGDGAIQSLLEILQTVKRSKIEDDGSIQVEGDDGPPSSALVRIPRAIESLKTVCPFDEYERILVKAHDYGDSSNPNLNKALGDVATPKAIGRLVYVLFQSHWGTETRRPAKEALVKLGKKAHAELLKALRPSRPTDREFQTYFRKEILDVLKETGDEDCLLSIRTLMADPLVAEDARATIEAISRRCGNVEIPDAVQERPLPSRTIARTGDAYVDSCYQIDFQVFYDERDWFEMPEAKAIPRAGTTEEALRLAEVLQEKHPDFFFSYYWFNILYRRQGRYDDARNIIIEGLHTAKSKSSLCERMAETEWDMGNLPEAVKWWIKSIVVQTGTGNLDDYVPFLHLSYVAEQLGLFDASMRLRECVDRIRAGQIRVTDELANEFYIATRNQGTESMRSAINLLCTAYLGTKSPYFDEFLSLVTQSFSTSSQAVRSALSLVLRHKGAEAEAEAKSLATQRGFVLSDEYPEVALKLRVISMLREKIVKETLESAGKEGVKAHRLVLAKWHAQKEQLEAEIAREIRKIDVERRVRSVDHQIVAMALPEGATLIEFARFNDFDFKAVPARGDKQWKPARYVAFVMPAREPETVEMIDLGEADPIDRMIAMFRSIIADDQDELERGLGGLPKAARRVTGEDAGTRLREAIFAPLLKAIGDRKRLLISPDGDLTQLPFEVLPVDDGRRLIDEYRISYLAAGRDVLQFDLKSKRKPGKPLVVADPDFDLDVKVMHAGDTVKASRLSGDLKREATKTFERLPGTKLEGKNIAAMLGAELWTGSRALDALLKKYQSPRVLHISTHGFFLEDQKRDPNDESFGADSMSYSESGLQRLMTSRFENPLLRSGLALAGVNTWLEKGELMEEAEDGLLTAEDVRELDLSDTELVVLPACDTGRGEVRVGEGVFGFRRAFVLAGAKTLVMSLWKVPDEQTREMMEDFYRHILSGEPRAEALRQAQLSMKEKYPAPFYWGAFICQGDPGPLAQVG